ncbi:MAG: glutamine synthetase III [Elusimicrobiota bacterium]
MSETRKLADLYGRLTFNKKEMRNRLSKKTFEELSEIIEKGGKLTPEIANEVATALKEWAISHGATHFAHWFQPQRGSTAEKHDTFLSFTDTGDVVESFSGKQLVQSEPDASSFPSGGMRSTFEARGYTAWDPTSPAFILKSKMTATLVIPSVYLSYTGEVLDVKTPLLRSLHLVEQKAYDVLKLFGNRTAKYVHTTAGPEQEYFLIDKEYYKKRHDIIFTGRTLIGASPAKGQQMEDHYFGSIRPKVLDFMESVDIALFERGIPAKTRHNEVAPNQFELAPIFEEANLAVDHNLQTMEIMKQIADAHGLEILFHEKPFAGINGSGKHLNWSLADSDGNNLFDPGNSPKKTVQFLVFLSGLMLGVNKFGALLRMAVADAGNDHRLGANEAPPAIMSMFLGDHLTLLLNDIAKGEITSVNEQKFADLKVKKLPSIALDNTDRNRTSPIAFTGNKFEFRAVGSSQNCAEALTTLNLLLIYGLDAMIEKIEKYNKGSEDIREAALKAIKEVAKETEKIRFEGNNYSQEWHKEAQKRGLPEAKTTPEALKLMTQEDTVKLFEKYEILSKVELHSKYDIKLDAYVKTKIMEFDVLKDIILTRVIPSTVKQLNTYSNGKTSLKEAGKTANFLSSLIVEFDEVLEGLNSGLKKLDKTAGEVEKENDLAKKAEILSKDGNTLMEELRTYCDKAESLVEDDIWEIPKYSEMLFLFND